MTTIYIVKKLGYCVGITFSKFEAEAWAGRDGAIYIASFNQPWVSRHA